MKKTLAILIPITTGILGLLLGLFVEQDMPVVKEFPWIEFSSEDISHGFSSEAIFGSEIPLPKVEKISGRTKFVASPVLGPLHASVGYLIDVVVEPLDPANVPPEYKEPRTIETPSGRFTISPVQEVVYEVSFKLSLKDQDGFVIEVLDGPAQTLTSGKTNTFQELINNDLGLLVQDNVHSIGLSMTVVRCITCDGRSSRP